MTNNYQQLTNALINGLTSPQVQKKEIVSVNGLQDAKNFILERGENIILRDCNEDIIYVKTCDDIGKYSLKVYECTDITDKAFKNDSSLPISRTDFEKLSNEMTELKSMFKEIVDGKYNAREQRKTKSSGSDTSISE